MLFETVVDYLVNFEVSEDLFKSVKDAQKVALYSVAMKPTKLKG